MQQVHQVLLSPILIPQYLIYTKYISVKQNKGIHKKLQKTHAINESGNV